MIGIGREWTHIAETLSDAVSSDASFSPVLMGRD